MRTKEEQKYLEAVAALGCICCSMEGFPGTPAEIHHIREGQGMSQRAHYTDVLPLCPYHHRLGHESFHDNPTKWRKKFGNEKDLVEVIQKRVEVKYES